jgi:antibiotic biosynthesis monooxygenase (ABM) superfamily enzyme
VNRERPSGAGRRPAAAGRIGPQRWKLAILIWLAIYPTLTLVLWLVGPEIQDWPLALRTLLITVVLVPVMVFVLLPALQHVLGRWMRPS